MFHTRWAGPVFSTDTCDRDDMPSARYALSCLSSYKICFKKSSFKKKLSEMLSFEHLNLVAENFGSDDLLKSPESPLKSPKSPLNLLKCGLMMYIIPQFIIISYISILVCMIFNKTDKYITFTHTNTEITDQTTTSTTDTGNFRL